MNIQEISIQSATTYYQYAMDHEKGNIEYTVRKIMENGPFFELHLASSIPSMDNMKVRIKDTLYEEEQIKILEYNSEKHTIQLLPAPDYRTLLQHSSVTDVFLVTNVRFLIKRTEEWYSKYGHLISLPVNAPSVIPYEPRKIKTVPSKDQKAAIRGILSAPLTYVWGAPGTGKTQFVLARSLLTYIKRAKRVLITAPTNRALEQILYGILPVLESVGIPMEKVLRLGVPTTEFAQKYPTVCESHQLHSMLLQMQQQIETTQIQLEQLNQQATKQKRYQNYLEAHTKFETYANPATLKLDFLSRLIDESAQYAKNIEICNIKEKNYNREISRLSFEIEKSKNNLRALDGQLQRLQNNLMKHFFKKKIAMLQDQSALAVDALDVLESEQQIVFEKRLHNSAQKETEEKEQQKNTAQQEELIYELQTSGKILSELHLLKKTSFSNSKEALTVLRTAIQGGFELFEEKEKEYADMPPYDAQNTISSIHLATIKLEQLQQALNNITAKQNARMDKCCVMAVTIDGCLTKILPDGDFQPDHIFLDEAGYAPLIKAATLTAFHCPITLLGDHMQLPPVCELNDEQFNDPDLASVMLWAQSALYLEDLFAFPFEKIHQRYLEHHPPLFEKLQKFDLLYSYRFSNSLASVLAGDVYSQALEGTDNHQTRIFYIHVPSKPKKNALEDNNKALKRYNSAECDTIEKFVRQNDDLEIGIITPYKNQKNALRKRIRESIEVNTVHGSQGREWDCVIFSVVDTTDQWFTNSLLPKSNGKNVVNTAVSRAKKQLVLVCDANYWSTQKKQLIGKLLSVAQELKI